jgi:hypothetical protein
VAEIVDGELHASPRPSPRHANVTSSLVSAVFAPYHHGRGGPGGWLILFEPELHLGRNVLVPDLAGWRRTRTPRLPAEAYFSLAPDWVCEVIAPSTASLDRVKKLAIYGREQIGFARSPLLKIARFRASCCPSSVPPYFRNSSTTGISTSGLRIGSLTTRSPALASSLIHVVLRLALVLSSDASCSNCAYCTLSA